MVTLVVGRPENIKEWFRSHYGIVHWNIFDGLHYSEIDLVEFVLNASNDCYIVTQSIDVIKAFSKLSGDHRLMRIGRSAKTSNKGCLISTEYDLGSVKIAIESGIELR